MKDEGWITVAAAAGMMGICKRQCLRRLVRRDDALGGRLLRRLGDKQMPGRPVQASKFFVNVAVLRESLRPDEPGLRDVESLRVELEMLRQQLATLRRVVRRAVHPIMPSRGVAPTGL